jgi:transposase-like protein
MARGVKRVRCVHCERHVDECGPLSRRYKCEDCGRDRLLENMTGLHNREGDAYSRWVSAQIRAAQRLQRVGM